MTSHTPTNIRTDPSLILGRGLWGNRLQARVAQRLASGPGGARGGFQFRKCSPAVRDDVAGALMDALDVGLATAANSPAPARGPRPDVWFLAAALDLHDQPDWLDQAAAAARQELRSSRLEGTVGLLLYVGRMEHQRPAAELLRRIDRLLPRFDLVVLLDDIDAQKWYWGQEKVEELAACFLHRVLVDPVMREWLAAAAVPAAPGSAGGVSPAGCLAVGLSRVDLSDAPLRDHLRATFCEQLFQFVFLRQTGEAATKAPPVASLGTDAASSLWLAAGGSLSAVEQALDPSAQAAAARWRQARWAEMASTTKNTFRALLPPDIAPPIVRPSRWQRIVNRVQHSLGFRAAEQPPTTPSRAADDAVPGDSTNWFSELEKAELLRLKIRQLQLVLAPPRAKPACALPNPLTFAVADLPEVSAAAECRLPDIARVAWELARELSVEALLEDPQAAARMQDRIASAASQALKFDQTCPLVPADAYQQLARRAAQACCPLFREGGRSTQRLAVVPVSLHDAIHLDGFRTTPGEADDEMLFWAVESGLDLTLLCDEEVAEHADQPTDPTAIA